MIELPHWHHPFNVLSIDNTKISRDLRADPTFTKFLIFAVLSSFATSIGVHLSLTYIELTLKGLQNVVIFRQLSHVYNFFNPSFLLLFLTCHWECNIFVSCWTVIEPYLYFFTDFYPWFTKFCHLCSFLILVIFIVFVLLIAPSSKLNYPFSHRFYIQCFMQDQNFVNFVNLVIETNFRPCFRSSTYLNCWQSYT